MSNEFRWVERNHMHQVLEVAAEDAGRHEVSQALAALYAALAPIELGCAGFEAADQGPGEPAVRLVMHYATAQKAFHRLYELAVSYGEIMRSAADATPERWPPRTREL